MYSLLSVSALIKDIFGVCANFYLKHFCKWYFAMRFVASVCTPSLEGLSLLLYVWLVGSLSLLHSNPILPACPQGTHTRLPPTSHHTDDASRNILPRVPCNSITVSLGYIPSSRLLDHKVCAVLI